MNYWAARFWASRYWDQNYFSPPSAGGAGGGSGAYQDLRVYYDRRALRAVKDREEDFERAVQAIEREKTRLLDEDDAAIIVSLLASED